MGSITLVLPCLAGGVGWGRGKAWFTNGSTSARGRGRALEAKIPSETWRWRSVTCSAQAGETVTGLILLTQMLRLAAGTENSRAK